MPYYHVLVAFEGKPNDLDALFMDASESAVRTCFLKPYKKGTSVISGNRVLPVASIRKVHIVRTDRESKAVLADLVKADRAATDELNRNSPVFFLGNIMYGQDTDIVDGGEDVTASFVTGPPGTGADSIPSQVVRWVFNNLLAIGTALAATGLAWWIGWH